MKYSIKPLNGINHLFRYDEDRGLPNNAEFQFWYDLQETIGVLVDVRSELSSPNPDRDWMIDQICSVLAKIGKDKK